MKIINERANVTHMSYTRRRTGTVRNALKKVGAQSVSDYAQPKGTYAITPKVNVNGWMWGRLALSAPSWSEIMLGFSATFLSAFVTAIAMVFSNMLNPNTNAIEKGLILGIMKAIPVYAFSRMPIHSAVKPLTSVPYAIICMALGQIGILGGILKIITMNTAALFAGGAVIRTLTLGVTATVVSNSIPTPQTTYAPGFGYVGVNLATVVCVELFVTFLIYSISAVWEHVGTDDSTEEARMANYRSGKTIESALHVVLTAAFLPFGSWTYDHIPYLAGLMAGVGDIGTGAGTTFRSSGYLFNQVRDTILNPNGVFTSNGAFAIYALVPLAGAGLAAAFTVFWTWLRQDSDASRVDMAGESKKNDGYTKMPGDNPSDSEQPVTTTQSSIQAAAGSSLIKLKVDGLYQ